MVRELSILWTLVAPVSLKSTLAGVWIPGSALTEGVEVSTSISTLVLTRGRSVSADLGKWAVAAKGILNAVSMPFGKSLLQRGATLCIGLTVERVKEPWGQCRTFNRGAHN